ncbi:hypothetical protein BGZ50_000527, partial [Haplosporangium sp. Z 11]
SSTNPAEARFWNRARSVAIPLRIEESFKQLDTEFIRNDIESPTYHTTKEADVNKASCIVLACVVLHSTLTKEEIYDSDENEFLLPEDDDDDSEPEEDVFVQGLDENVA